MNRFVPFIWLLSGSILECTGKWPSTKERFLDLRDGHAGAFRSHETDLYRVARSLLYIRLAPFVATLVDVTGLVIYFTVASIILRGTLL